MKSSQSLLIIMKNNSRNSRTTHTPFFTSRLDRRAFLAASAGTAIGLILPKPVFAAKVVSRPLRFYNIHTRERMVVDYTPGSYGGSVRQALEYFLRDFRTGEMHTLDALLFDSLYAIQNNCEVQTSFEVISGYRSPSTNEFLWKTSSGVARNSLHMQGRALDIRVSGLPTKTLRDLALNLHQGGVGFYPSSDFVHLDTGGKRSW
ncbi:YcbK family protein [Desulfopila inferna]|uniref:YcbK family protein n=1 Tax=Desulfopila inferna TaxID=468528 RepID=UPI00196285D9|nr:YcbK family protein [Desulfopila inferna]MBM9604085.1 YcbK family protein [Desulfopila inferna]